MNNYLKKYLLGCLFFLVILILTASINSFLTNHPLGKMTATVFNPDDLPTDARPASGFAWNDNIGWINFGDENSTSTGRVYVSNNKLYGYAWGENVGWISMACSNDTDCNNEYGVSQTATNSGILTGYAWGENIGWISFNCNNVPSSCGTSDYSVTIDSTSGEFDGYAWGENVGWISFSGSGYGVTSDWIYHTFTYTAGANGTITGSSTQTILDGDNGTEVTASPSTNYEFDNWSDGILTAARTDINASSSITVTANFREESGGDGSSNKPACTYSTVWGICDPTTNTQVGTSTATNQQCTGEDPKIVSQNCTPEVNISIDPLATTTIFVGDRINFTATVTGATTTSVYWDITNLPITGDGYYGTIDDNTGLYIAPADIRELTFLSVSIRAKSKADPAKTASITITVRPRPLCTNYTYSEWSGCINNLQSRTASSSIPDGCSGGILATTTQSCVATSTASSTVACISYAYSDWSNCINGEQSRVTLSSSPDNCVGGQAQINSQSCLNGPDVIMPLIPTTETPDSETSDTDNHPGGGNHTTDEVPAILDISNFVADNIVAVLGTTTEKIFLGARKIAESNTGSVVTKTITTAGVIGGGIAATGVFAVNGTVAADLLFLPFKLWGLLLSALGLKKRNRPWGTVYDSVTKQPLDPAYVTLKRLGGNEENTSITDLDGRYGFLVSPGQYVLTANKTNYLFPSKKMSGKTDDTLYNNLYFGETIDIQNFGALINKNIPLDPIKFDWNEFVKGKKKLMKFYSRREKIVRLITDWIFRIGFVISLISLFLVSAPYNLIIFGLYIVITTLRKMGLKQKALGTLTEANGDPLSFAIVRVFASDLNVEITNKVADRIGRYYCLVNKGKYYVKIDKKNDDESYSTIFTSPAFEAENGIINKNFIV